MDTGLKKVQIARLDLETKICKQVTSKQVTSKRKARIHKNQLQGMQRPENHTYNGLLEHQNLAVSPKFGQQPTNGNWYF